jgi:hypothetical protein
MSSRQSPRRGWRSVGAREIAARMLSGVDDVPVPRWYRDLTAGRVPKSLRHALGSAMMSASSGGLSEPFASCEPSIPLCPDRSAMSRPTTKQQHACPAAGPVF